MTSDYLMFISLGLFSLGFILTGICAIFMKISLQEQRRQIAIERLIHEFNMLKKDKE